MRAVARPVQGDIDDLEDLAPVSHRGELAALAGDSEIACVFNHDMGHGSSLLSFSS
jgi:hypothetical protein